MATVAISASAAVVLPGLWSGPTGGPGVRSASYSILGHDPLTGEFGVASASNAPLIGVNLDYFDPEAGGIVAHGGPRLQVNHRALVALREGLTAGQAIQVGLAGLPEKKMREGHQVLAIAPSGAAAFTGKELEKQAAQKTGEAYVAGGYRLEDRKAIEAMAEAFEETDGPLADRLLTALQAGRDAGGEKGGAHSAALLIVGPGARYASRGRLVDLRIDFVLEDAVAALATLKARIDSVYGVR